MQTLEKNIINLHGDRGKEWLRSLPIAVAKLSDQWRLTEVKPVNNMSWNFVAFAVQDKKLPVVLKISCDKKSIQEEYQALCYFAGVKTVKPLDINRLYNALLLEQAVPGNLLKESHALSVADTIVVYAEVVKSFSTHALTNQTFTHVREWLTSIDRISDFRIAKPFVETAQQLRDKLLRTVSHEYVCHGDLHLENIIQRDSEWVVIDPKGIIGEIAFEAAAFDLIDKTELNDDVSTITAKLRVRIAQLSKALNIHPDRLLSWIFLRIILSAQWFIEDNGDPTYMLKLAGYIYPLFNSN